jgi:hypothetical protein
MPVVSRCARSAVAMDFGNQASFVWSLLFGAVGAGYCMYGKKLQKFIPLACGLGLMVVPCFVGNTLGLVVICGLLCVAPFVGR